MQSNWHPIVHTRNSFIFLRSAITFEDGIIAADQSNQYAFEFSNGHKYFVFVWLKRMRSCSWFWQPAGIRAIRFISLHRNICFVCGKICLFRVKGPMEWYFNWKCSLTALCRLNWYYSYQTESSKRTNLVSTWFLVFNHHVCWSGSGAVKLVQ